MLEENNVGKGNIVDGNKSKERTSKNNDEKCEEIREWRSKLEEFDGPSPLNGNGIKSKTNYKGFAFDEFLTLKKNWAMSI